MTIHSLISSLRHRLNNPTTAAHSETEKETLQARFCDVFIRMWDLGFTSFGGPPVHFQILHRRFVEGKGSWGSGGSERGENGEGVGEGEGRKWVDEQTYQELFALNQALPGPASTKMCFCIALLHAGIFPATLAFTLWSLPGALTMFGLALGVHNLPSRLPAIVYALLSGLNASTVGIVALAAVQLAEKASKIRLTRGLVVFNESAELRYNALWYFPVLVAIGVLVTVAEDLWEGQWVRMGRERWGKKRGGAGREEEEVGGGGGSVVQSIPMQIMRPEAAAVKRRTQAGVSNMESEREDTTAVAATPARTTQTVNRVHASNEPTISPVPDTTTHNISVKLGLSLIAGFFTSFIIIMVIRATLTNTRPFNLFSNIYVVDPGWVSPRDFLLGLAIIQAMPGPNFNFAVYLGALAVSSTSTPTIIGAILGFIGIFFPGMVLAVGVQSVWQVMRTKRWVLSLLRGINATAVGLVFTAVYRLWEIGYLMPESSDGKSLASEPWWVVVAAVAYAETAWFGVPPAAAILIGAVLGLAWYGAVGR
ncbi:conserved hypothetical protein [Pyrenophora tritici-repentis Pt-1C-BFP]|uniref:ChrA, Chromate transport protein ChrA n=1 Tax=Pyrenophora tritici-repentis (strain Pt-1C-BFP) TaxID=426418 RepID=B2WAJ0_PYRTR|nr:uncharacterized protein PTRG_07303 [Pyrenophora tritici-repentis Pt-1C-BFP]EDU50222.1 conserved hypothetical protein [Pyrenophora tritici-repentis Pt-1C-BFP]